MRRLAVALAPSMAIGLLLAPQWTTGTSAVLIRTVTLGLTAMPVFGLFERWPTRPPNWIGRWALQVIGVGIAMPLTTCRQQLHALRGAGDCRLCDGAPHISIHRRDVARALAAGERRQRREVGGGKQGRDDQRRVTDELVPADIVAQLERQRSDALA